MTVPKELIARAAVAICPPAFQHHEPCEMHVRLATKVLEAVNAELQPPHPRDQILAEAIIDRLHGPSWCYHCGFRPGHQVGCPIWAYLETKDSTGQECPVEDETVPKG